MFHCELLYRLDRGAALKIAAALSNAQVRPFQFPNLIKRAAMAQLIQQANYPLSRAISLYLTILGRYSLSVPNSEALQHDIKQD